MFNINKYGIVWTSAFVTFSLTKMVNGDGIIVHGACMVSQTMLLFLFMWLQTKHRQHDLWMKKWKREMKEIRDGMV
jgi:hypothetical protein